MINFFYVLATCLMISPFGNGGDGDKKGKDEDVKDTYYKYEREDVSYYRDRVAFTLPSAAAEEVVETDVSDVRRLNGRFNDEQKLVVEADPRLQQFIDKHKKLNEEIEEVQGWKVQVYAGRGRVGREEANGARSKFLSNYPDYSAPLEFQHPLYRVRVGDFMRREEAELFCRDVRTVFPGALIVKDKVKVPKYKAGSDNSSIWNRN